MREPREGEPPDESIDDALFDETFYTSPPRAGREPGGPLIDPGFYAGTPRPPAQARPAPSLSIILISSACGVAGGVIGLYISYGWLGWGVAWSAGAATLGLLFGVGLSGAALTAITGERAAWVNMAFSCALIALVALFMGMCAVAGAAVATLLVGV